MKKIIIALFSLLAMFQLSCNPIEEEHKQGSVIAESELKLDVYPLTEGGNKIVMINNTPMVGSHWNYGSGISVRQQDTVLVPFLGEKEIVFTGICAGGTISTTRKVTIDNILYPIEDEWAIFAGTDKNGKDWMWDYTSPDDVVWGNGGYPGNTAPAWATIKAGDMDDQDPEVGKDGVMHFDLNGAANFTKISQTGKVVEKGSFKFDMTKQKVMADGTPWSIGTLTIVDGTFLKGVSPNEGGKTVHEFDILKLTEDKLVLAHVLSNGWEAWFWCFKVKK